MMPVLAALCGAMAWGQQAPLKIAVIDMQSALLGTKDGQKAVAEFKAKFAPREQEFQKRQADLAAKQAQYRKTQNTMSDEAKASLQRTSTRSPRICSAIRRTRSRTRRKSSSAC